MIRFKFQEDNLISVFLDQTQNTKLHLKTRISLQLKFFINTLQQRDLRHKKIEIIYIFTFAAQLHISIRSLRRFLHSGCNLTRLSSRASIKHDISVMCRRWCYKIETVASIIWCRGALPFSGRLMVTRFSKQTWQTMPEASNFTKIHDQYCIWRCKKF